MTIDYSTLDLEDIIDVRDLIERFEELESEREDLHSDVVEAAKEVNSLDPGEDDTHELQAYTDAKDKLADWDDDNKEELDGIKSILDDLKGYGGDEQWRGGWYPVTLIRDSYFPSYTQELVEDCYQPQKDLPSFIEIDWEATARNIRVDYSSVEINGTTYWYR